MIESQLKNQHEDLSSLSPSEFLNYYKNLKTTPKKLSTDDELYLIFLQNDKAKTSPNQLIKACRAAGLKCSHARGHKLFNKWSR